METIATISCDDVLHLRPLAVLGRICLLFPNTDLAVTRRHPGPNEPKGSGYPKQVISMVMQCFANGEDVVVEATGEQAQLAALVVKAVLENMSMLYSEANRNPSEREIRQCVYRIVEHELAVSEQQKVSHLLRQAQASLLEKEIVPVELPCTTHERSAILADRLHNATVEVLPLVAAHFKSAVVLSFIRSPTGEVETYDLSRCDDSWARFGLLAAAPPPGTVVMVRTNGPKAESCAEYVAGILRLMPKIDDYIREQAFRSSPKTNIVPGILDIVRSCVIDPYVPHPVLPSRKPVLHDLLTEQKVQVEDAQMEKDEVLRYFASVHEAHTGMPAPTVLEQIYIRERHLPCFQNGVAIPHARVGSGPLVSVYLGLYSRGISWVDGAKAYVVLLFVAAADAPETYATYLAQACRILGNEDSLADLLQSRTKAEALAAIRLAEIRMGAPLPSVESRRVLVVESLPDEHTLLRDRYINEDSRMDGIRVGYFYACTEKDRDIIFDPRAFLVTLKTRIQQDRPHFVLLHTGIAFRRYTSEITAAFKALRVQFPEVRFGSQNNRGISVDSDAFDHDAETLRFQQEFFAIRHGG